MGKIIFILGGARSGKSRYAVELASSKRFRKVAFIAACEPLDDEMKRRIRLHQKARPRHWQTFEEPYKISSLVGKIDSTFKCILIDCLTIFVSNLVLKKFKDKTIEAEIKKILSTLKKKRATSIIVSNEVGLGIVPENRLGRDFRDIAGRVNQITVSASDITYFMVSGIPWKIK